MWDRIVFFELRHYGDLHITRNFVRYVINNIPARRYTYVLNVDCHSLADFPELTFEAYDMNMHPFTEYSPWMILDSTLYINTSCGTNSMEFYQGTTVLTAHKIFKYYLKAVSSIDIPDNLAQFVPMTRYGMFKIRKVDEFMQKHGGKRKIMIVNGETQSGQTMNFDMYPLIEILAYRHPDCIFFVSNYPTSMMFKRTQWENVDVMPMPNVYYCADILQIDGNDIVETAYFTVHCDLIIGRSSGVYTLSIERRNVIDNPKKWISFNFTERDKDLGMTEIFPKLKDNFIWSNNFNFGHMIDLIEQHI